VVVPAENPDLEPEGEAWPAWLPAEREAILQPLKPLMKQPQRAAEREAGHSEAEAV
jgi:hypothetical protein